MNNQHQALYAALSARDRKFDGRFFVGVSSTGIYCLRVAHVRRKAKIVRSTLAPLRLNWQVFVLA